MSADEEEEQPSPCPHSAPQAYERTVPLPSRAVGRPAKPEALQRRLRQRTDLCCNGHVEPEESLGPQWLRQEPPAKPEALKLPTLPPHAWGRDLSVHYRHPQLRRKDPHHQRNRWDEPLPPAPWVHSNVHLNARPLREWVLARPKAPTLLVQTKKLS